MSMVMNVVRIKPGYSEIVEGVEFKLTHNSIKVYVDGIHSDEISTMVDGLPSVHTNQQFQEQAMWWLYEWNLI